MRCHISNLRNTFFQRTLVHNRIRNNEASTESDNDSDSGRLTETNIRRAPSRSALRTQATASPVGPSPKDLRQCVNPRARPTKPLPQLIVPGSFSFEQKKTPPRCSGRRSNYAHLTSQSIRGEHHSFVKSGPGLPTTKTAPENDEGADNYALFTYFLEITGPILRRPDGRVTGWSRAAGITAPSKERSLSGYPSDSLPLL